MILSGKKYVKYEKGKTLSDSSGVSIPWILVKTGLIMKSSRLWQSVSLQTWMVLNGETVQRLQQMNFDAFTRAESSITNKIQGTGLGMAMIFFG